jgi:hypothetical protein
MTLKLSAFAGNKRKIIALGVILAFIGILLSSSFQFIDNHKWYWTTAPVVCGIVLLFAACGGLLVGHGISRGRDRRLWLSAIGGVLGIGWIGTGILAAGLAALGMYYLPMGESNIGWDSYSAGYFIRSFNISFLQLATVTGVLSGFAVGLGLAVKRFWALTSAYTVVKKEPFQ